MFNLPMQARVYLCATPVDLRKSFDGLSGLVESVFQRQVLDGHLFLFINRRRDRIKVLWWDQDGLVLWLQGHRSERVVEDPNQLKLSFGDDPAAQDALADAAAEAERIGSRPKGG
ncbi:MAG: IS66 family insertion sequence element accessory protein TnpB [Planctomycetes bacterium]|nr:IS66 family insertion sequence element accessory protein TnpB [Planctomycetota bacterium]